MCRQLEYDLTDQWRIVQKGQPEADWDQHDAVIAQLRCCFGGNTLHAQRKHPEHASGRGCKLLLHISADLGATEAALCRWAIAGTMLTKDDRQREADKLRAQWSKKR